MSLFLKVLYMNTSKSRNYSFFLQGCIYYELLPTMNARPLVDKFVYYLKLHRLYTSTLSIT